MWEPLSDELQRRLFSLGLSSPRDLSRCRPIVRRLARDLPTFDSVWLDALVQRGQLTPFQARRLESPHSGRLAVGPAVFVDRLGGGPLGETFLARIGPRRELCAIKVLRADLATTENEEHLGAIVTRLRQIEHPSLVAAHTCDRVDECLVLVSRYIPGFHLAELLVRRGRFPAAVVWEIGRQLAEALALVEANDVAHGDIRLSNVRLTRSGIAVLVDPGIRPILDPAVSVHSRLPPERYDGLAPELIGTNRPPDAASDRYALGCLLWQLLAGRPPFPGGDPLVKLAAHQTRRIGDVGQWAPDAPAALVDGLRRLTDRDPAQRPQSYREMLALWGAPVPRGRRRLAKFRRWFDAPAPSPRPNRPAVGSRRIAASLLCLVGLCGIAAVLSQQGAQNIVLSWSASVAGNPASETEANSGAATTDSAETPAPGLPPTADATTIPDADPTGTIRLAAGTRYVARDIHAVGPIHILGPERGLAEIVVAQSCWTISAESVRMERARISRGIPQSAARPFDKPLLRLEAQSLAFASCRIEADEFVVATPSSIQPDQSLPIAPTCLAWRLVDPDDRQGGDATFRDCVLIGAGPALHAADAPRRLEFSNCLRLAAGPLVYLASPPAPRRVVAIRLNHATCRNSSSLLRLVVPDAVEPRGEVSIEAHDCVFDFLPNAGALLELIGREARAADWLMRIRISGEGSIAPAGVPLAVGRSAPAGTNYAVDSTHVRVEGVLTSGFRFAGEASSNPTDSEVREWDAPRRTSQPPGIVAERLAGGN